MFQKLLVNREKVRSLLTNENYTFLADYLNEVFKLRRNEVGTPVPYEFSSEAVNLLCDVFHCLIDRGINENNKNVLKELLKSFRNYVINAEVQKYLINAQDFLDDIAKLIGEHNQVVSEDILQISFQFLINLIISNKPAAIVVYDTFSTSIFSFLKEKIIIYETTALLYNIILQKDVQLEFDCYDCLLTLINSYNNVEFIHFLVEKFISCNDFWNFYKQFDLHKRMTILGIIRDKQIRGNTVDLPENALKILTNQFISSADVIFQTASNQSCQLEPYEISQLLQVISSICSDENYLKMLQNDKDLLIHCGILLINIHKLGKAADNCFTSIQSLSEIREPNKTINEHPAFGFKADLIRIVGNLCWKNQIMQDLVREAELIPVILDCCNMDARNPFIIQWAILAVRNLCENNSENQRIISEMHQEGAVNSEVLEEMGVTLQNDSDNNSLKIIPLENLRNKK